MRADVYNDSTGPGAPPLATLDLPTALSQRVVNALRANPKTVELRSQAQHFYNLGARMTELFEGDEMVDVLTDVRERSHQSTRILGANILLVEDI